MLATMVKVTEIWHVSCGTQIWYHKHTHTHTQRYKTHSGASKLTHPKIYTYATFYELTAAIFITMNE